MRAKKSSIATLAAALLVVGAGTATAGDGNATAKMMPASAMVVAHVNFERLQKSPLYQDLYKQFGANAGKELDELKAKFGIDLQKDVKGMTLFVPADIDKTQAFAVVFEGKFPQDKITAAIKAEEKDTKEVSHNGKKYWVSGKDGALAFMDGKMVVAHQNAIKGVLDAKGNAALKALSGKAKKSGDIWFAAALAGDAKKEASKSVAKTIPGAEINSFTGSLDLADGMNLALLVGTNSGKTAQAMVAELNKGLEEAKKQPGPGAMMGNLLSGLKMTAKGNDVSVNLAMSQQQVNMVKGMLGMFMGMANQGGAKAMPPPAPAAAPAPAPKK